MIKMTRKQKNILSLTILLFTVTFLLASHFISSSKNAEFWKNSYEKVGLKSENEAEKQPFSVHFIDVGQGDCIFIKSDGKTMLIDAGEAVKSEKVEQYLRGQGVSAIDYLIATHPHSDHIGSLPNIINDFEIKNVILSKMSEKNTPTTKVYENLLRSIKKEKANVIAAKPGESFMLGKCKVEILAPFCDDCEYNNLSVVLRCIYGKNSFIFMGDAEQTSEKDILKSREVISADVVKIGHHGSVSSSSEEFLNAVSPKVAVIMCGVGNDYGHPHKETLEKLSKRQTKIYRTDLNSNIVIGTNGTEMFFFTDK